MIDQRKQALLDGLASAARKLADNTSAAAKLHRMGEMIDDAHCAKIREEITAGWDALHGLLPQNQ